MGNLDTTNTQEFKITSLCQDTDDAIHSKEFEDLIPIFIEKLKSNENIAIKDENLETLERLLKEINDWDWIDWDEEKFLSYLLENEGVERWITEILKDLKKTLKDKNEKIVKLEWENADLSFKEIKRWLNFINSLTRFPKLWGTQKIINAIKDEARRQAKETLENQRKS